MRQGLTFVVAAVVAALAACADHPAEQVETSTAVPVSVAVARIGPIQGIVSATGIVSAAPGADWTITAPELARIVELPKAAGDRVHAGDLLVRFEIPSITANAESKKAEVAQAQTRLANATSAAERAAGLYERGIAARKDVEDAQRELADAQAAVVQASSANRAADVMAARAVVRARFSGVVAKRWHNPGDLVDASMTDPILRVIDPARLQVIAAVPVAQLTRIAPGCKARVLDPAGQTGESAAVLTKPAAVDPASATGDVRLAFAEPTRFAAGTPVQIELFAEEHRDAVLVPAAAIVNDGNDTFVFAAGSDNKAQRRPVTVGLLTRADAEIISGIQAGETVIVRGQDALPDGAVVTILR